MLLPKHLREEWVQDKLRKAAILPDTKATIERGEYCLRVTLERDGLQEWKDFAQLAGLEDAARSAQQRLLSRLVDAGPYE